MFKNREGKEDGVELIKKWLDEKKEKNSFYEKAVAYALLYQAQLKLSKGDYDSAIELLVETFRADARLCVSDNYIVFILSILKKLVKVTKKANEGIIKCVDTIQNSATFKHSKSSSIILYLADIMLEKEQYQSANKLYEFAMNNVKY